MSADRSYTEEVRQFGKIVEGLKNELSSFRTEILSRLDEMNKELKSVKRDADVITEGDKRHGVEPVRLIAEEAKKKADSAHERIDMAKWVLAGLSAGAGVGGGALFEFIMKML